MKNMFKDLIHRPYIQCRGSWGCSRIH